MWDVKDDHFGYTDHKFETKIKSIRIELKFIFKSNQIEMKTNQIEMKTNQSIVEYTQENCRYWFNFKKKKRENERKKCNEQNHFIIK